MAAWRQLTLDLDELPEVRNEAGLSASRSTTSHRIAYSTYDYSFVMRFRTSVILPLEEKQPLTPEHAIYRDTLHSVLLSHSSKSKNSLALEPILNQRKVMLNKIAGIVRRMAIMRSLVTHQHKESALTWIRLGTRLSVEQMTARLLRSISQSGLYIDGLLWNIKPFCKNPACVMSFASFLLLEHLVLGNPVTVGNTVCGDPGYGCPAALISSGLMDTVVSTLPFWTTLQAQLTTDSYYGCWIFTPSEYLSREDSLTGDLLLFLSRQTRSPNPGILMKNSVPCYGESRKRRKSHPDKNGKKSKHT